MTREQMIVLISEHCRDQCLKAVFENKSGAQTFELNLDIGALADVVLGRMVELEQALRGHAPMTAMTDRERGHSKMRTIEEIRNTPVLFLTADEIEQLSPDGQAYARLCQANRAREMACIKHEPEGTSTRNGWHNLRCKRCGKNMSFDSGD